MNKSILLFTVIMCFALNIFAQNCKSIKEKKDSFTGQIERSASVTFGSLTSKWIIEFSQTNDQTTMKWGIAMTGEYNQFIEKGTSLLLKLKDETILNLATIEQSNPVTQVASGGSAVNVYSIYYLKFNLSNETLNQLAKSPIIDLKIEIPNQKINNPKIKEKQMEGIREVCECLLKK